ncbi:MAG: protein kinase [Verrucomicrobiales bacterium]|nr:protein kinase [Verrucomicrobiales bacterium]
MTEPATPESASGPQIPDHELLRQIGRGSYGEVWLARNIMGTHRAVKIVYQSDFKDDRPYEREWHGIKRFEPISRSHDGFVDILQVGRNDAGGYFYLVMELADDVDAANPIQPETYSPRTLSGLLRARAALDFDYCVALGLSLSSAVAHLHAHGLIHRDIKPSNIIFVNGIPKLADIGMVTEAEAASFGGGTVGYLAPDPTPSPRSDVYSLGKVLYEVSTGNDRLQYPSVPTFWQDTDDPRNLAELNEVVIKACDNDASKRYPSAREMHEELLLLQAGKSVKRLRSLERRQALVIQAGVAAGILVIFTLLLAYRIHRGRERESIRLADSYVATAARLAGEGNPLGGVLWQGVALDLDQHRPARAARHRINIETTLRLAPRLVRMFFETNRIRDIAFDPSGDRLALALSDGKILVRDIRSGVVVSELLRPDFSFVAIDWHPSGRFLAAATTNGLACLWDLQTHENFELRHPNSLLDLHFSHDGTLLATVGASDPSSSTNAVVRLWDWRNQKIFKAATNGTLGRIRTVAFDARDRRLVTGGEDQKAYLWDAASMNSLQEPLPHPEVAAYQSWVMSCNFSPDNRWLATASFDQLVRVWPTSNFQSSTVLTHRGPVRSVEFSPDAHYLLTAADDFTVRVWDFRRGTQVTPPLRLPSFPTGACFNSDGRLIAAATGSGVAYVWDLAPLDWTPRIPTIFSPDGSLQARVLETGVQVFSTATGKPVSSQVITVPGDVFDLRFNENSGSLLIMSESQASTKATTISARLFEVSGGKAGNPFTPRTSLDPQGRSNGVAGISDDGKVVLIVNGPHAQFWDGWSGLPLGTNLEFSASVNAALSRDGQTAAIYFDNQVELVRSTNGARIKSLTHSGPVVDAEFNDDGSKVVTACRDDEERPLAAHLWDAATGAPLGHEMLHSDGVSQASFTPDHRFILTAGEDQMIKQWTLDGQDTQRRFVHAKGVVSFSLNPDGTRMSSATSDNTVLVWDLANDGLEGVQLTPPVQMPWNVLHTRFVGQGDQLLVKRLPRDTWTYTPEGFNWSDDWKLYAAKSARHAWQWTVLDLRPLGLPVDQLTNITQLLSAQRLDAAGAEFLTRTSLQTLWGRVSTVGNPYFQFAAGEDLHWHGQEVERAEVSAEPFAVRFHVDRFLRIRPNDQAMLDRKRRLEIIKDP